jgi:DNA-binding MarR family transcriptional regulator
MAVLGQSNLDDSDLQNEVIDDIPSELLHYRYLMHPIRLSIMKLLYKNFSLTSVDIRNQLKISWGEYNNHITSSVKNKFVSIHTEFHDANQRQVVYLEELGRKEYDQLVELLDDFLQTAKHDFESDKNKTHCIQKGNK